MTLYETTTTTSQITLTIIYTPTVSAQDPSNFESSSICCLDLHAQRTMMMDDDDVDDDDDDDDDG